MVLPVDLPDEQLQALIQHELTHIFQYEILFQGWRGRAIFRRPPTWFMEGMASYFADDEDARAESYMRDAALAERVPSVMQPIEGYFAYRFGHKVFEYIESEWGEDGVRDFVFAFRGGFGTTPSGPIRRTFNMTSDEFDSRFRSWLRRTYQPYADRGLPRRVRPPLLHRRVLGRGLPGGVPVRRPDRRVLDLQAGRRRGALRRPRPAALQEPHQGPDRGSTTTSSPST